MVQIDRDNFDAVMASLEPRLGFSVPNTIGGGEGNLGVDLVLSSFEDFEPINVLEQIPEISASFTSAADCETSWPS
jgi:type VI secretion system protein ImpB